MRLLRFARNDEFQGLIMKLLPLFSKPRNNEFYGILEFPRLILYTRLEARLDFS